MTSSSPPVAAAGSFGAGASSLLRRGALLALSSLAGVGGGAAAAGKGGGGGGGGGGAVVRGALLARLLCTLQVAASTAARAAACALLSSRPPPPSWRVCSEERGGTGRGDGRSGTGTGAASAGSSRAPRLLSTGPPAAFVPPPSTAFCWPPSASSSAEATLRRGTKTAVRPPRRGLSTAASSSEDRHDGGETDDDAEDEASSSSSSRALCSSRGRAAPGLLPVYLSDARAVAQYHPVNSPDGALQLSVAENQMLEDLLVPALSKFSASDGTNEGGETGKEELFRSDQIYYQQTHGREGLRRATAGYLERLLRLDDDGGDDGLPSRLDPEGLVMGAGCNAVLENLCLCLAEPGEAVLIPAPYYAAFEFDLVCRANLTVVPVNTMAHSGVDVDRNPSSLEPVPAEAYYPTTASLDASYEDAAVRTGAPPRILLLSHPNNPLGVCYPPDVVRECVEWGRRRKVHVVSDEIYAGSVHGETKEGEEDVFVSALKLARGHDPDASAGLGLGPYVHFVYALSKDFALSGLRVGVCYSENKEIRLPMQKLNDLCQISSQTQLLVERMLSAPSSSSSSSSSEGYWSTDEFLPENRRRLRDRREKLERTLTDSGIPYLPSDSGLFVWMDLREFLPSLPPDESFTSSDIESRESMERRERSLYLSLLNEHGLLFTPGLSMKNELPGFFRCVYSAASDGEFELGLERIGRCADAMRRSKEETQ